MTCEEALEVCREFADAVHAHCIYLTGISEEDAKLPEADLASIIERIKSAGKVRFC